jgi:hypothetical protein
MEVEGVILILSCKKHRYGRLKNINLKHQYVGWKVIKVIGELFLKNEYELVDDILFVKCEDSYLHLLKKLALSLKYLYKIFIIKQGVLRCGDDLIFNEENLIKFLESPKYDFYGRSECQGKYITDEKLLENLKFNIIYDDFMLKYYYMHKNELIDKEHGINMRLEDLIKYLIRPDLYGPVGIIYYISNKSCNIIINTMEEINYNIYHLDEYSKSYPYLIEDGGATYIMYRNKIPYTDNQNFFIESYNKIDENDERYKNTISIHTNFEKDK